MQWIGYIGIGILVLLVLLVLVTNIQIVQQSRAYVVERLGAYSATWGVGLHFKIPFFERVVKKVSLKEQVAAPRGQGDRNGGQRERHGRCVHRRQDMDGAQRRRQYHPQGENGKNRSHGGRQALRARE